MGFEDSFAQRANQSEIDGCVWQAVAGRTAGLSVGECFFRIIFGLWSVGASRKRIVKIEGKMDL